MTFLTRTPTRFPLLRLTASLGTALAALFFAGAAQAQQPNQAPKSAPEWRSFRSEDGSEFLLLPNVKSAPPGLVHWVVATPSGPLEDPPGRPGLARAVLRSSVGGTSTIGSLNWNEERAAIELVTSLRQQILEAEARGDAAPDDLLQKLAEASRNAERLGDRSIWLDRIRRSPAVDVFLEETPGTTLLHLTTRDAAIPRVAALLLARRERAALRDVDRHYQDVQAELRRDEGSIEKLLGRELMVLAFPTRGTSPVPTGTPAPIPFTELLDLHAQLLAPAGTRHVLAGSFDPDAVESVLRTAFAASNLKERSGRAAIATPPSGQRAATISGPTGSEAAAMAMLPPKSLTPEQIDVLTYYLIEGEDAPLRAELKRLGFPRIELYIRSPFPADRGQGLLAIFAEAPARAPGPPNAQGADQTPPLDRALVRALERIFRGKLLEERWNTATLRVRADRAERQRDARSLSRWLGRDWASLRRLPTTLLGSTGSTDDKQLWNSLKESLLTGLRITVHAEGNR